MALFPTSMHVISVNVLDLSSLVSWCQPFSSDSRKNRTGNIVPDTEDCSRKCCQRACRKICSRKGNGKSAVLHSDFNCDCCCLGIFNMKYFRSQKAKSHTAQIVDRHNNQYKHTAAYNFFCIDGYNSGNDHHDRYTGIRITFTTEITIAQKDTSTQVPARI